MSLGVDRRSVVEEDSFESLVSEQGARLFALAYLILQDHAQAEDAVQDSLLRAWRHQASLRSSDRLDSWLTSIVLNAARDQARRSRLRRLLPTLVQAPSPPNDPQHDLPIVDEVQRALRSVSNKHREVLVLRYYLDMETSAIGEELRVPEGTVRSRLHHALRALRAAIDAQNRGTP